MSLRVYGDALVIGNVRLPGIPRTTFRDEPGDAPRRALPERQRQAVAETEGDEAFDFCRPQRAHAAIALPGSEDLRHIKNEWRRFWFNDQPSHLTPERIHGGIL
jgi:hypothetical protein